MLFFHVLIWYLSIKKLALRSLRLCGNRLLGLSPPVALLPVRSATAGEINAAMSWWWLWWQVQLQHAAVLADWQRTKSVAVGKSWLTIICSYYSWIILIFNVVFWYFFGGFLQWINGGSRRSPWLSIPLDTKGLASVPSCRWSIATSPNSWCHMILPMPHAMGPAISQCKEGLWLLFLYL